MLLRELKEKEMKKCYTCQDIEAGCSCPDPIAEYELETLNWAYKKLLAYGTQNGAIESALMMDRFQELISRYDE